MINAMPLPFAPEAIAPQMSRETFEYHYDKHFMAYVNKTNKLVVGPALAGASLEDIIRHAHNTSDTALFQAAGQAWNHAFFWKSLSPVEIGLPDGAMKEAVARDFGSIDAFAEAFVKMGKGHFGSGWVWLIANGEGRLSLAVTHDAMPVWVAQDATPLLVCDVWEHAYYIDWRNNRGGFLKAFIESRAHWDFAFAQLQTAGFGKQGWFYPA